MTNILLDEHAHAPCAMRFRRLARAGLAHRALINIAYSYIYSSDRDADAAARRG
jgi:hypothetical protein